MLRLSVFNLNLIKFIAKKQLRIIDYHGHIQFHTLLSCRLIMKTSHSHESTIDTQQIMYKSYIDPTFFLSILGELVNKTNLNKNLESCRGEKK